MQYQLGEKLLPDWENNNKKWELIESKEVLDDLEILVYKWFDEIFKNMDHKINARSARITEQLLEYIHEYYSEDISLNKLSKKIYFTPNYLSGIFSKNFNEPFREYLIKYRLEKAKELLRQNKYKIYEVAIMVGYSNLDYFRRIFKNYTGYTPTEYIELL
jgi:two-component system response regulator YesN